MRTGSDHDDDIDDYYCAILWGLAWRRPSHSNRKSGTCLPEKAAVTINRIQRGKPGASLACTPHHPPERKRNFSPSANTPSHAQGVSRDTDRDSIVLCITMTSPDFLTSRARPRCHSSCRRITLLIIRFLSGPLFEKIPFHGGFCGSVSASHFLFGCFTYRVVDCSTISTCSFFPVPQLKSLTE